MMFPFKMKGSWLNDLSIKQLCTAVLKVETHSMGKQLAMLPSIIVIKFEVSQLVV